MSSIADIQRFNSELSDVCDAIQKIGSVKSVHSVIEKAGQPMLGKIRSTAPSASIAASFGFFKSRRHDGILWLGPKYSNSKTGDHIPPGNLTHIFERGTKERFQNKGLRAGGITRKSMEKFSGGSNLNPKAGKSTGKITATYFVERAFNSTKDQVEKSLAEGIEKLIEDNAKSLGFKVTA